MCPRNLISNINSLIRRRDANDYRSPRCDGLVNRSPARPPPGRPARPRAPAWAHQLAHRGVAVFFSSGWVRAVTQLPYFNRYRCKSRARSPSVRVEGRNDIPYHQAGRWSVRETRSAGGSTCASDRLPLRITLYDSVGSQSDCYSYRHSNGTVVRVVLGDLDLNFQGDDTTANTALGDRNLHFQDPTLDTLISRKRWKHSLEWVLWLL